MTSHNGLLVAGGKGINSALNVWDTRSNKYEYNS
jgi:kinesin family protein 4/21/27